MILERSNLHSLSQTTRDLSAFLGNENTEELNNLMDYYQLCRSATNEFGAKLENLDSEYSMHSDHNPIHHMEERLKDVRSLMGKLKRKGYPRTIESVKAHIFDIGGIRVVCNYIDDVYTVAEALSNQSDVTVLRYKDYIKNPKESGYRSLHIVASVPVFLSTGAVDTPVEIQLRTVGMDMWASLEHRLRYKTDVPKDKVAKYGQQLHGYAEELNEIESSLQSIFKELQESDK